MSRRIKLCELQRPDEGRNRCLLYQALKPAAWLAAGFSVARLPDDS